MCLFFIIGLLFTHVFPQPRILRTFFDNSEDQYIGFDASALLSRDCNFQCISKGKSQSHIHPLDALKNIGINTIKLKMHYPASNKTMQNFFKMIQEISQFNLSMHLSIDLSFLWRNKKWEKINQKELQHTAYDHLSNMLSKLKKLNALPRIVSIGNGIFHVNSGDDHVEKSWQYIGSFLESEMNAIKGMSKDIEIMIDLEHEINVNLQYKFIEYVNKKHDVLLNIVGLPISECAKSDPSDFDAYLEKLEVLMDEDVHDLRFMIIAIANDNYQCFESMKGNLNNERLGRLAGIEWIGNDLSSESFEALQSLQLNVKNKRSAHFINASYLFLICICLPAIGYNYFFWKRTRKNQQSELLAIIKKG